MVWLSDCSRERLEESYVTVEKQTVMSEQKFIEILIMNALPDRVPKLELQ
jgi:hypothetical protein